MTVDELKQKIIDTLPAHLGYRGLLSQLNMDQGDTLQRVGTLAVLTAVCDDTSLSRRIYFQTPEPDDVFRLLETSPGWYRRSPNPAMPAFETDDRQTSRDQLAIAKAGMVAQGLTRRLWGIAFAQLLRLTFHQNFWSGTGYQIPDVLTPDEAAIGLRGLIGPLSLIPNMFLDLSFLVNLGIRWFNQKTGRSLWGWDNMFATMLLTANLEYPTVWSKLATRLYLKTDFMSQLYAYHNDETQNGCEPLYWLFRLAFLTKYGYDAGTP